MYRQITSNKRKSLALLFGFLLLYGALGFLLSLWFGEWALFAVLPQSTRCRRSAMNEDGGTYRRVFAFFPARYTSVIANTPCKVLPRGAWEET